MVLNLSIVSFPGTGFALCHASISGAPGLDRHTNELDPLFQSVIEISVLTSNDKDASKGLRVQILNLVPKRLGKDEKLLKLRSKI